MARDLTKLMPVHESLPRLVKEFPKLKRLVDFLGEPTAASFLEQFAGELIYLPSKITLNRMVRDEYILRSLRGKRRNGREYEAEVIRLASLFGLSEKFIEHKYEHLRKNGKYV